MVPLTHTKTVSTQISIIKNSLVWAKNLKRGKNSAEWNSACVNSPHNTNSRYERATGT